MKALIRPAARKDILRQYGYFVDESLPRVADRFLESVEETIQRLTKHPNIGSATRLEHPRLQEIRRWPVKNFHSIWIFYTAEIHALSILRILHEKRDIRAETHFLRVS